MTLTAIEQRITGAVAARAGALLDDLRLHVGLATGPGGAGPLEETRARLGNRLAALGAVLKRIPGDARPEWLETTPGPPGPPPPTLMADRVTGLAAGVGRRVLLAGHLDTVHDSAGGFRELSIAPGGKSATGPGCVDMKGGLVIAVAALEALEECGVRVPWSFVLNSDEETGSYHSAGALASVAREHDIGLALEPAMSKGELAIARGGSGQFMIEAFGRAAHVGRDFAVGVSAVDALCRGVIAAHGLSEPGAGLCVNVSPLRGGGATNVVADHARAWGNVRFPAGDAGPALEAALARLATAGNGLPRVVVHRSFNRPAKPMLPATERLGLAARAVAEDLGQSLPFGTSAGVCDGNNLQAAGLPTIDTLGVRGGGLHTPEEWIELASLVERCQLLAVLTARLGTGTVSIA
ncbi:MAG: M20/M25/M40 family metallo-hydrolase [Phycisphaerales bacterium]